MMWEERFAAHDGYLFGASPSLFLMSNPWVVMPTRTALCVADGEGRNSVHLARHGMSVTAFDVSQTAVERAGALASEAGTQVAAHVSAWDQWEWSVQFDMVAGIFIQFVGPQGRAKQFDDMKRAVRSGGRLVLHGYRPEQVGRGTGGPPDVANMYTEAELRDTFAGWTIERCASYEAEQTSGRAHVGQSALIDFVARKP